MEMASRRLVMRPPVSGPRRLTPANDSGVATERVIFLRACLPYLRAEMQVRLRRSRIAWSVRRGAWQAPSLPHLVQRRVDEQLEHEARDQPADHRSYDALHHVGAG